MDYKGRVAFITGGAGGVGQELGRLFLEKGSKVCLIDIREDAGNAVVKKLQDEFGKENAIFLKCNITSDKELEDAYDACEKTLGTISIVCNNAGVFAKDYRTSMDINFGAVAKGTELAFERMGKHNGGKGGFVVNTASTIGVMTYPCTPMYCATKAAVVHYSRCMGHEFNYNYSGVHVLSVCPGIIDTPLTTIEGVQKGSLNSFTDKLIEEITPKYPKLAPREVAEAIHQLIEEKKSGAALLTEAGIKPYYVPPSVLAEYS